MKIINGEYEIYASGTLYSPGLSDTRFIISETPPMEIVFRIRKNGGETGVKVEAINEHTLALVFENPLGLGYGLVTPAKVGHLNGKELYVTFSIDIKGDDQGYYLTYAFSLKGGNNG